MKLFIWLIAIVLWVGCNSQKTKYPNLKEIADDVLVNTIMKYVDSTSLNPKERFVAVKCIFRNSEVEYHIAAGRSSRAYQISPPDFFSILDDVVVIFWVTNGETFKSESIQHEINDVVAERAIRLDADMINYDPPLWKLYKYEGKYRLDTKPKDIFP